MIYHLLEKPIRHLPDARIEWACACGLRVALPPTQVPKGTAIQVADPKGSAEQLECPACYAGTDERGETPPPVGAGANERELQPTFDTDLGEDIDEEDVPDETPDEVLGEENEEYPA